MNGFNCYVEAFRKYFFLHGRSSRKEFCYFALFNILVGFTIAIVDKIIGINLFAGGGLLAPLYSLFIFIPSITMLVRRLHDTSRSGWWTLLILIPILGAIVLIIFCVQPSEPRVNKYGEVPLDTISNTINKDNI